MSRFLLVLLAVASTAQAQQFQDYEAAPAGSACSIREAAGHDWRFLWSGRCVNGYAQGEGTLRSWRGETATVEKGAFSGGGYKQGLWEIYSRATKGDREITNFLVQYERGLEAKDAKSLGGVRPVKPRDLPGWAEVITSMTFADAPPARAPAKPAAAAAAPAAPPAPAKPAAPAAVAAAPAAALPALSAGYKGHLYVVRFDVSDSKGTSGDFMSFVAPDRASAQRLYDDYATGRNSLTEKGLPVLGRIDECDGRGAGPYFAIAVLHDTRDNTGGGAGWVCGAPSPDGAARAALGACKTGAGAACQPRAEADVYLLVSTHAAGGASQVNEVGTFASGAASTRVWNNYDYSGCLWAAGKLDAEGGSTGNRGEPGNRANTLRVDCRSYF